MFYSNETEYVLHNKQSNHSAIPFNECLKGNHDIIRYLHPHESYS